MLTWAIVWGAIKSDQGSPGWLVGIAMAADTAMVFGALSAFGTNW